MKRTSKEEAKAQAERVQSKMAKKPRSQRRKKGKGDDGNGAGGGGREELSEEHTIADSITTFSMLDDENDNSFGLLDDFNEELDTDDLINNRINGRNDNGNNNNNNNNNGMNESSATARRELQLQDALFGLDEFASTHKAANKREHKLRKLFKGLTQCAVGVNGRELVYDQQVHVRRACLHSLRQQQQPSEQYAACRCLEAASVVLGAQEDEWVESLDQPLRRTVLMTTKATAVRMAALRALSMAVFVGATETETTEALMDLCEQICFPTSATAGTDVTSLDDDNDEEVAAASNKNKNRNREETATPTSLRATALDCWALLATTVHDFYLAGQDDTQMGRGLALLSQLAQCLEDSNSSNNGSLDLRSAAGRMPGLDSRSALESRCGRRWRRRGGGKYNRPQISTRFLERQRV